MAQILFPHNREGPSLVENTEDLACKRCKWKIKSDEILVSFDVWSCLRVCQWSPSQKSVRKRLEKDTFFNEKWEVSADTVVEMLKLCLDSSHFQFRGKNYHLEDGLTMGLPVSPPVANLLMADLEEQALFKGKRPEGWLRYQVIWTPSCTLRMASRGHAKHTHICGCCCRQSVDGCE